MARKLFSACVQARSNLTWSLGVMLILLFAAPLSGQIVAPPTAQARPEQAGPPEETNIYLVTFRPGTAASERAAVAQGAGAVLRRNFNSVNAISVEVPNVAALAGLRNNPLVLGVFANRSVSLHAGQIGAQAKGGKPGGGGSGGGGSGGGGGGGEAPVAVAEAVNPSHLRTWLRPRLPAARFLSSGRMLPTMKTGFHWNGAPCWRAVLPKSSGSQPT